MQTQFQPDCDMPVATYTATIAERCGWEGLGDQGIGCEWLAGLVWEGPGGLGMGCKWVSL